jgi:hypothetical protein
MGAYRRECALGRLAITTTVDVSVDSECPNRASAARGFKIGLIPSVVHQVWLVSRQFCEEFLRNLLYITATLEPQEIRPNAESKRVVLVE